MLEQLLVDRPYLENKYHKTTEPFNAFARMAYHGWEGDPATGLDDREMAETLKAYVDALPDTAHPVIKAKAFAFVLDHMRIGVDPHDYFVLLYNWNRPLNGVTVSRWSAQVPMTDASKEFIRAYSASGDVAVWMDYDHAVPDWGALYRLGFPGIRDRAAAFRAEREKNGPLTEAEAAYFDGIAVTYGAILRLLCRLRDYAAGCTFEKAPLISDCLGSLANGAPKTLFERLMLIYLYFMLSESVDSYQVRSLGSGLDRDLERPYHDDLAAGRHTAEQLDGFIGYFLMQFSAIGNYWGQPLYLGGTYPDGKTKVSDVTMRILEIYDALGIFNPKIQVKYSRRAPAAYLAKIIDMIRRGHSSFVFICEDNVRKTFLSRGIPQERAWDFDVKGCYEFAVRAGEFSTAPFYINLLGSLVRALARCNDSDIYETVEAKYFEELTAVFEGGIRAVNEMEGMLGAVNPSNMLSATITSSLERARDAYHDGAEYETTVMIAGGLGSAVDALMAVKQLVFVRHAVTLGRLKEVLAENWSDVNLRAQALALPQKFGCGEPESDACAEKICRFAASYQGRPNSRGGVWKMTLHSARQYIELGKKTPATPDGRLAGEETSKNASPTQGMDRQGVTALIRSALATCPAQFTEGHGLDAMLHETAVRGEDGMAAMKALLCAYDAGGGTTIQFNVFNASTLHDAQAHPGKYQNLQIRVCGWNVLFNNMCKAEQDAFIRRAEAIV